MAEQIEKLTADVEQVSKLSDLPNQEDGLTSAELKAVFDKGPKAIKEYVNNTLVPAINKLAAELPSKVSQLVNDAAYITKAVTDLENYYRKNETYTQAEVNALVSAIPKFGVQVVSELPTAGISTTTVYLLPGGDGEDLYTEYIYVGGVWEILGCQKIKAGMTVTFSGNANSGYNADKTYDEIDVAHNEGRSICGVLIGSSIDVILGDIIAEKERGYYSFSGQVRRYAGGKSIPIESWTAILHSDDTVEVLQEKIVTTDTAPVKLPNPHALTISGQNYDGSQPIFIPDPDWVATKTESGGNTIVIPEQTISGGMWSNRQYDIRPGISYTVFINGKRYTCIAHEEDGGIYLGNPTLFYSASTKPHNNEPFCVYWAGGSATGGFFYKDSTLSYPLTMKVTDGIIVEYNKMPEGYLPDCVVKSVNGVAPDESGNVEVEGGLTDTARALLITILRNAVYTSDQSTNIAALENALAGGEEEPDEPVVPDEPDIPDVPDEPEPIIYTITAELVNVTSSNSAASVTEGESYNATLTAADGYEISTVTVLMGGVDVTADVYANGVISIPAVTGNVEIVASAIAEEKPAELPTDGLLAYFDLRNASAEKVGTTTGIPTPTLGNGSLFSWASNAINSADDYGAVLPRPLLYDAAGGTSQTDLGTEFTCILLTRNGIGSDDSKSNGFVATNINPRWQFCGKYNKSSGTSNTESVPSKNGDSMADYNFQATRANGNALKLNFDTSSHEFNGADYDDFVSWYSKPVAGTVWNNGTTVAVAIYSRALTDVEIEEAHAFMKTLEVA